MLLVSLKNLRYVIFIAWICLQCQWSRTWFLNLNFSIPVKSALWWFHLFFQYSINSLGILSFTAIEIICRMTRQVCLSLCKLCQLVENCKFIWNRNFHFSALPRLFFFFVCRVFLILNKSFVSSIVTAENQDWLSNWICFGFNFLINWSTYWCTIELLQEPEYKEFVKAATADNEIQFIEVSNIEVANALFPNIEPTNRFLGIVKNEPERYTAYGELVSWYIFTLLVLLYWNAWQVHSLISLILQLLVSSRFYFLLGDKIIISCLSLMWQLCTSLL